MVRGLGVIIIRHLSAKRPATGFVISYRDWLTMAGCQPVKHFDLFDPPYLFRQFAWAHIDSARDRGEPSPLEREIDLLFAGRPLL